MSDGPALLDMSQFATTAPYGTVNLVWVIEGIVRPTFELLSSLGRVREHTSFGYAVTYPDAHQRPGYDRNDPTTFIWFIGGWGPDWLKYAANAIRKLLATARTSNDTLWLRIHANDEFQNIVTNPANPDGTFPLGEFPHGGAILSELSLSEVESYLGVAVSCLKEYEDDWASRMIGGITNATMVVEDGLLAQN